MKILFQTGLYLGPVIIGVLLYHSIRKNRNNIFLAALLACSWYSLFMIYMVYTQEVLNYPYLLRTGNLTSFLAMPFLYLFVRNTFYPGNSWKKKDWLFLIPCSLYAIDLMPYFLLPAAEKQAIFAELLTDTRKMNAITEGWMAMPYFHFFLKYLYAYFILLLTFRLIFRNRDNQPGIGKEVITSPYKFTITITALFIPGVLPGFLVKYFFPDVDYVFFTVMAFTITYLGILIYLLISPKVLYGYTNYLPVDKNKQPLPEILPEMLSEPYPEADSGKKSTRIFELVKTETVVGLIENAFYKQKLFKQPGYSIHDLSKDISIPVYQLSVVINRTYKSNFNNWINKYRVEYFLSLSAKEENKNLTYEALAREAGFTNRVSFSNAFKKEKAMTPGQYLKMKKGA